jgi:hypothetical protein
MGFCHTIYGQTGQLQLSLVSMFQPQELKVELYQNDSLIRFFQRSQHRFIFDSLPPGTYSIKAEQLGVRSSKVENIRVGRDSISQVSLSFFSYNYQYSMEDSFELYEATYMLLYGQNTIGPLEHSFQGSFVASWWGGISKSFDLGLSFGYYGDLSSFRDTIALGYEANRQYYFGLGVRLEIKARTAFYEHRGTYDSGLFLDYGIAYKAPAVFRLYSKNENEMHSLGRLHDYTDFRPFVSVGFRPVSAVFEYRVNDFIKSPYPQAAKYNFGVRVNIK